jgi:hypothetical protein
MAARLFRRATASRRTLVGPLPISPMPQGSGIFVFNSRVSRLKTSRPALRHNPGKREHGPGAWVQNARARSGVR